LIGLYILLSLPAIAILAGIFLYNRLVRRDQMARNGWSDIDVQLKRRADLVPHLVDAVKGYAAHEQSLFAEVVEKRNAALAAGGDVDARGRTESDFSQPVARLIALGEAYPELKASENFLGLQKELANTENKIEMARRFYNGAVRELNVAVSTFPGNLLAGPLGFAHRTYFEIKTAEAAAPQIDLRSPRESDA
jgi:LemA protein